MVNFLKPRPIFSKGGLIALVFIIYPVLNTIGGEVTTNGGFNIYLPLVIGPDAWAEVDPDGETIVFWHNHSGSRETVLIDIVDEFNSTNPWGITVIPENQGSYNDIYDKMLAAIASGDETPDLVVAYQNHMADYHLLNALVDMNPLVEGSTWGLSATDKADFFPGIYAQDIFPTYNNVRLGFPPNRSLEVLYYNMDWLIELGYSAPPTTTVQFQEMACAAVTTPFSGRIGTDSMGYQLSVDASRFASWVFAFGGDLFDNATQQYTLNSQAAVNSMTYLQNLFNSGCAEFVSEAYGEQTDFANGELLFALASSSGLPYYQSSVDNGSQFNWSVSSLPYTGTHPTLNIYGASVSMPKHTSERELAAWLFLKYFTTPDVQDDWARASNYFPVRQSVADNLGDYFLQNPQYEDAFSFLPYGKSEPATPNYQIVRDLIYDAMVEIMQGADVTATLNQLNTEANATLP